MQTNPPAAMANLTVKGLPDALYEKLKARAQAHHRSITGETTVILERALGERPQREDDLLRRARQLRERTPVYLREAERKKAAERGRP